MKTNWKVYVRKIKSNSKRFILSEKKRLVKLGTIILAVITVTGGVIFIFTLNNPHKINNKPAKIIEMKNDGSESKMFLEHVEQLKSGLYEISSYVFAEENMRMNETFGESSSNFVSVQGNFKIKYSVDVTRIRTEYNFENKEVIFKIPTDAVGIDSVELVGTITELEKHESFGNKIKDWIPMLNDDEEMKEKAINQLLTNSKIEANDYNRNELQIKASKALNNIIDKINQNDLKYKIEFVNKTEIGIKNK